MANTSRTIQVKFDGDAKDLIAASKAAQKAVSGFGRDADGKRIVKRAKQQSESFGQIWEGGLRQLRGNFIMSLGTIVAIIGTLPIAGAIASAGLVSAFGLGLAGLGIAVAAQNVQVQNAFRDMGAGVLTQLQGMLGPIEGFLTRLAGQVGQTFDRLAPSLDAAFANVVPGIDSLITGLLDGIATLGPAIEAMSGAFSVFMAQLGPGLTDMFAAIGDALVSIADTVTQNADVFAELFLAILNTVPAVLDLVGAFAELYAMMRDFPLAMGGLMSLLLVLPQVLNGISGVIRWITGSKDAADQATPAQEALADAMAKAAGTARQEATGLQGIIDKLTKLGELTVTESEATIAFETAIDNATKTIKENGRTLDLHTKKGRENQQALNDIVTTTNQRVEAEKKAGAGTKRLANLQARGAVAFTKAARAAGMTAKEIDEYTMKVFGVPGTRVTKLQADKRDAESKLRDVKRQLQDPNLTKTRRAKLEAKKDQLERAVKRAKILLDSLKDKTVTITTYHNRIYTRPSGFIGPIIGHAKGGRVGRHSPVVPAAGGGMVRGPGSGTSDQAGLFALSNKEYVLRAAAVERVGTNFLDALNRGDLKAASATGSAGRAGGDVYVTVLLDGKPVQAMVRAEQRGHDRGVLRRARAGTGAHA